MPKTALSLDDLENRIFTIRGLSVLLDSDLAKLYGVNTKVLLQAMRRNRDRFPQDFVFFLAEQEVELLRPQIVTSKPADGRGGRRYARHAFTEQGVAMLSSVLRSETAIQVNIAIMRAFVRLRRENRRDLLASQPISMHIESKLTCSQQDSNFTRQIDRAARHEDICAGPPPSCVAHFLLGDFMQAGVDIRCRASQPRSVVGAGFYGAIQNA